MVSVGFADSDAKVPDVNNLEMPFHIMRTPTHAAN